MKTDSYVLEVLRLVLVSKMDVGMHAVLARNWPGTLETICGRSRPLLDGSTL